MNKLYILMIWTLMSCHNDIILNQNQSKHGKKDYSHSEFINEHLDSIDWHSSTQIAKREVIPESIFYRVIIDYYSCTIKWTSNSSIQLQFDRKNIYFLSSQLCLLKPHSLEYFDIDDYHAFVLEPLFSNGNYKDYSILRIPLNSNLECLSEVSIILTYSNYCKQNDKSEL